MRVQCGDLPVGSVLQVCKGLPTTACSQDFAGAARCTEAAIQHGIYSGSCTNTTVAAHCTMAGLWSPAFSQAEVRHTLPARVTCRSESWLSDTGAGASVSRHWPVVDFGNAMTSRMEGAPAV